jgi:hypothetical protein
MRITRELLQAARSICAITFDCAPVAAHVEQPLHLTAGPTGSGTRRIREASSASHLVSGRAHADWLAAKEKAYE